jgi:hypothetical protein
MGVCYTIFFVDEFDWDYKNFSKSQAEEEFLKVLPYAEKIADFYRFLVFDINKIWPDDVKDVIRSDAVYYVNDIDTEMRQLK